MSLKVCTSFTFDWKIISNELKSIMMQLPFNYNSLWDKRWWGLELKSEEKLFLDQPWHSILEGRLLATYFCDLWTLWYWGVTFDHKMKKKIHVEEKVEKCRMIDLWVNRAVFKNHISAYSQRTKEWIL